VLELGEAIPDRVQIGRAPGQQEDLDADGTKGVAHGAAYVEAETVHDHDVAWLQVENPGDVEAEGLTI
jgi:hypothetical protein